MASVEVTINGRRCLAETGQTVLEAAKAAGVDIPTLCNHPALPPQGSCRICMVEIEKQRGLHPACTFPVMAGMVVHTQTPKVVAARRFAISLLLSDHPLDCMTCARAGHCELQDLAYEHGITESPYKGERHVYPIDDPNPFYQRDYSKCVLCRRCVQACHYINGVQAIGMVRRGFDSKVGTAFDGQMEDSPCEFCGMCAEVCPTGALTTKQSLGEAREWELKKTISVCPYCGMGCQLELNVKDNRIVKVSSVWDAPANHGSTCVKGRFGLDFIHHPDRLRTPLIRREGQLVEASWDEALDLVAAKLGEVRQTSAGFGAFASAKCTNEDNYVMQKFARAVMGTHNVDHCARL